MGEGDFSAALEMTNRFLRFARNDRRGRGAGGLRFHGPAPAKRAVFGGGLRVFGPAPAGGGG